MSFLIGWMFEISRPSPPLVIPHPIHLSSLPQSAKRRWPYLLTCSGLFAICDGGNLNDEEREATAVRLARRLPVRPLPIIAPA